MNNVTHVDFETDGLVEEEKKSTRPVLDLDNEDFLNILLEQTEKNLATYRELEDFGEEITEAIGILKQRRDYIIRKFEENGFQMPNQERPKTRVA